MKKKIKTPVMLRMVSWLFPRVERLSPWLAKQWFVRIFFTPVKYKMPHGEVEVMQQAKLFRINFEGKQVQVYEWGAGKPVLFVHGWMGRGPQFRKFIPAFNDAGYQVVAFDATAHGLSEGRKSHIMEFARIIEHVHQRYGTLEMIVGHSIGGVASMHAIHRGLPVNKLVMIGSPSLADKIIDSFLRRLNASPNCAEYLNQYIVQKYGKRFEEYTSTFLAKDLRPINLLLIHDEEDEEVEIVNAIALKEAYPAAKLIITKGKGHTRILKDEEVVQHSLEFVQEGKLQPV